MKKNFKRAIFIIPLALLFLSNLAFAQIRGDTDKGEDLYERKCESCHTKKPKRFAGRSKSVLVSQLTAYKTGTYKYSKQRKMKRVLIPMSRQQILDIATYLSKM